MFTSPDPLGSFDVAAMAPGGARVAGWALDPETPEPIAVHVYVDGSFAAAFDADAPRPDIGQAYPGYGDAHGFDTIIPATPGSHSVCVYGINRALGANVLVGCRTVNLAADPFGSFDLGAPAPGGARVAGWALDPNVGEPIDVHVYVDGAFAAAFGADANRPDIAQAYPGYGNAHGFDAVVPVGEGFHTACAYGINRGAGANALIGCRWVMLASDPFGSLDVAEWTAGGIRVAGWALDPNVGDPIGVHVYVDGAFATAFDADTQRPDIGQAYPGYGNAHGYDRVIPAASGPHTVCAYGINAGAGTNVLIGCRSL